MNSAQQQYDPTFLLRSLFRLVSEMDWWLLSVTAFLVTIGLSTLAHTQLGISFYDKQIAFVWAGLVFLIICWRVPYFVWTQKAVVPILYGINLGLLLAVMLKGHTALGAQRWLAIGPITLQPSELAKPVVIFTLAAWLGRRPIRSFFDCFKALALIVPPALLVFKQPDLGTSLTFGAIYLGMCFWAGATATDILVLLSPLLSLIFNALNVQWWVIYLVVLGGILLFTWRPRDWSWFIRIAMVLVVLVANAGLGEVRPHLWGMLKDYQQKRLTSFLNPYADPRGSGYHILQSLIAIGSGGVTGQGLGKGNQSQGAFIPERQTDFIFSVIGEELGFKISALIVAAYAIICLRALKIAYQAREEPVGSLIAIGLMSMFLFHVFLNIGMTMGIMPVAGVPLPFLSYGGTALLVDLSAIGILQSIRFLNPPPRQDVWR